ncbi:MAG: DegT/DnrJ/EryC1/StrS family aminotransferase [Lachnospiraceae bacterium]|nr:DegT/DnrJ/EryC1/StrS family aminotransferase [Lachnospiraceae bacterium]
MEPRKIIFSPPDITEAEIEAVAEALRSGWITTGPRTKELEKRIAAYLGTNKAVALNSATASEELNLRILGIGEGDEVLVPAYTYTASASAAIHVGAKVRFIDCQKDSLEMDYDAMEAAINEKTKAVIPVDIAGIPCDYDRIYEIVNRKKVLFTPGGKTDLGQNIQKALGRVAVVSDSAHSFGASRKGKMAGTLADFSSFSFHAVKNLTTAEGGASVWNSIPGIDDEELYHWYQLYSLHGQDKDALAKTKLGSWEYDIIAPLYKCNLTDVGAAIGLVQMDRYPSLLKRRREIIEKYDKACDELGVEHLTHYTDEYTSSGHLYLARIPGADDTKRREIITKMAEMGVPCNVHYKPLPMMTAYKSLGFDIKDYPNAYAHYENEVTLPLHTKLSDDDVDFITECFAKVIRSSK